MLLTPRRAGQAPRTRQRASFHFTCLVDDPWERDRLARCRTRPFSPRSGPFRSAGRWRCLGPKPVRAAPCRTFGRRPQRGQERPPCETPVPPGRRGAPPWIPQSVTPHPSGLPSFREPRRDPRILPPSAAVRAFRPGLDRERSGHGHAISTCRFRWTPKGRPGSEAAASRGSPARRPVYRPRSRGGNAIAHKNILRR